MESLFSYLSRQENMLPLVRKYSEKVPIEIIEQVSRSHYQRPINVSEEAYNINYLSDETIKIDRLLNDYHRRYYNIYQVYHPEETPGRIILNIQDIPMRMIYHNIYDDRVVREINLQEITRRFYSIKYHLKTFYRTIEDNEEYYLEGFYDHDRHLLDFSQNSLVNIARPEDDLDNYVNYHLQNVIQYLFDAPTSYVNVEEVGNLYN